MAMISRGQSGGGGARIPAPKVNVPKPAETKPKIKSERGQYGVSTRSSKVDKDTKRMVNKNNKAAKSYQIKDLDAMDKNRMNYIKRKEREIEKLQKQLADAKKAGFAKGAAATATTIAATAAILDRKKEKNKK